MTDNKKKLLKYWFFITNDYRSEKRIYTYTNSPKYGEEQDGDNENDTPEEACDIEIELPKEGQRLYIVNEYPYYKPIWHKDIDYDDTYQL